MDFTARYILVKAPTNNEAYIERLKAAGMDEEAAKSTAESSAAAVPESAGETFDIMLDNEGDADEAASKLSQFVFGKGGNDGEDDKEENGGQDTDEAMDDVPSKDMEEKVEA